MVTMVACRFLDLDFRNWTIGSLVGHMELEGWTFGQLVWFRPVQSSDVQSFNSDIRLSKCLS